MKKLIDGTKIVFSFEGCEQVIFDATKASEQNRAYAIMHGFQARIGDNAAIQKSAENGYVITESIRREAVLELVTHYEDPAQTNWNLRAAGPRVTKLNAHVVKYAEAAGLTYEQAMEKIAQKAIDDLMAA
jgi:hypothetical protein